MTGMNPSFYGLTYNLCGHFFFPLQVRYQKNFLTCTTFKFWKSTTKHFGN